ncbi:hypothetical protein JOM56_014450 [Amanita muscaria]
MRSFSLSNKSKELLLAVLDKVDETRLIDLTWEPKYEKVHGVGTSKLEDYKLGSMKGTDAQYHVGIFRSVDKRLIPPPLVVASWPAAPDGAQIISGLRMELEVDAA